MKITDEWTAGFADGEGWFGLNNQESCLPQIRIANTNLTVLETIRDYYQVGRVRASSAGAPGNRTVHFWVISHRDEVRKVCEALLPHLNVKQRQATILLRLLDTSLGQGRRGPNPHEDERVRLMNELHELNRRFGQCQ